MLTSDRGTAEEKIKERWWVVQTLELADSAPNLPPAGQDKPIKLEEIMTRWPSGAASTL